MTRFTHANFLEYLYNCIATRDNKFLFERLDRDDFLKINKPSKLRQFIDKENLEIKLLILAKLNYNWAVTIWDNEKVKTNNVFDMLALYHNIKSVDGEKTIIKDKVFSVQPVQIIKTLGAISKASTSRVYSLNTAFLQIPAKTKFNRGNIADRIDAEKNIKWLVEVMDNTLSLEAALENNGLTLAQLRLLLFLYNAPNGATKESVKRRLGRERGYGKIIGQLSSKNMVKINAHNKNVVEIDVMGLTTVEQIISKVLPTV